jgi:hypothetical protein
MKYDLARKLIVKVTFSSFIKKLIQYRIRKIQSTQSLLHDDEAKPIARLQLVMLLEHDCVYIVDLKQEGFDSLDLADENSQCLAIGLAQCSMKGALTCILNAQAINPYLLVANQTTLEVFYCSSNI